MVSTIFVLYVIQIHFCCLSCSCRCPFLMVFPLIIKGVEEKNYGLSMLKQILFANFAIVE